MRSTTGLDRETVMQDYWVIWPLAAEPVVQVAPRCCEVVVHDRASRTKLETSLKDS